jgi:hypothetical protein
MRIAYVVFGVTSIAIGISWLVKGDGHSASGGIQVALGVGWLMLCLQRQAIGLAPEIRAKRRLGPTDTNADPRPIVAYA